MSQSTPEVDEALAAIGHRIHHAFGSLVVELSSLETEDGLHASLVNESQRFGLWAKNLGLYDSGHSSLDYRFRDAPSVYEYARQLLADLEKSLSLSTFSTPSLKAPHSVWQSSKVVKVKDDMSHQQPEPSSHATDPRGSDDISDQAENSNRIAEIMEGYRKDPESDESSEEDESYLSYQQDSISTIIRNSATRLGFSKARTYREIDEETGMDLMDEYASFDVRHVSEIIAHYQQKLRAEWENHYLIQRLARANTHRRRQFGQWRRHRLKLESAEKAFAQTMGNKVNVQATPMLLNVPRGSEKGTFSLPSTATRLDEENVNLNDTASVISSSTYAVLFTEDDENNISIPPLPEKLCTGEDFECPYCHVLCSKRISSKMAWERHGLRDLRPYMCTYEDCTEADQQYDNIKDWVSHEINVHRDTKLQSNSPSEQSSDVRGVSQSSKLVTRNDTCRQECPICLEKNPSFVHIGRHLQRVAVFALPRSTGAEDEISMEGTDSKAPKDECRDSRVSSSVVANEETSGYFLNGEEIVSGGTALSGGALKTFDESTEHGIRIGTYVTKLHDENAKKSDGSTMPVIESALFGRDHKTDQINMEGDEYLSKEYDGAGDEKVDVNGNPQGGRAFKIRTFLLAWRHDKRFMFASECAGALGYKDLYSMFNWNPSLFKINLTRLEKDDLIKREILPYSYGSRRVAVVTAKSIFRHFGSKVIENGRRVLDDYWERKAREQGFSEDDLAGDEPPGASIAREAGVYQGDPSLPPPPPPLPGPGSPGFDRLSLEQRHSSIAKPPIGYVGYNFTKQPVEHLGQNETWEIVNKELLPASQTDLEDEVEKHATRDVTGLEQYMHVDMRGFKRKQVDELIRECVGMDPDHRFEYVIASIKRDTRRLQNGPVTSAMQVILKRQPRAGIEMQAPFMGFGSIRLPSSGIVDLSGQDESDVGSIDLPSSETVDLSRQYGPDSEPWVTVVHHDRAEP